MKVKVFAEDKVPQRLNVVDNIANLFGFSRGSSGYCRQFVVFSTLRLFMRFAYLMACGHYALRLSYELRSRSTASLLMRYAYRHP